MTILSLPGFGGSGPTHWQSLWEARHGLRRVHQRDWEHPVCLEWQTALESAVADAGDDTVLVAHSLACLLVAHWAASTRRHVKAALLVAVPDPSGPQFPAAAIGFSAVPMQALPFRSITVASTDDPYGSLAYSTRCASAWDSSLVCIGAAGHINAASGLGDWDEGMALLQLLIDGETPRTS
jgi:predicted alpha/beta hydrolase family esterase